MRRRGTITLLFCAVCVCADIEAGAGVETVPGAVPLATDLKVSGPAVSVRSPLGVRYRPGCAFQLEVYVHNSGSEFDGEVQVLEGDGDGDAGSRSGPGAPMTFPAQGSRVLSFPVRAGSVSANLTLLIREIDKRGAPGPLRFRASLSRVLKPLAPEGRIVVSCGEASSAFPRAGLHESTRIAAREFPDEAWMYESIDLVILGDASLKEATPAARSALRNWLLGGGRILIASNEALPVAIAAGLVPVEMDKVNLVGADRAWWEQHAGLKDGDILASKNNRPIYARLGIGLGQVVFLFPATPVEDAIAFGPRIVNHPSLQRARLKLPDMRVQPDRYDAFPAGAATLARRGDAVRWIVLGAVMFCASLALAFSSRSRLVAAGWPLALTALLAVMLAHWFPVPELIVSRVELSQVSEDGRAMLRNEWTCVETFSDSRTLSLAGPAGGTITPLFADSGELKSGQGNFVEFDRRLRLQDLQVAPNQPLLATASAVQTPNSAAAIPAAILHARSGKLSLSYEAWPGSPDANGLDPITQSDCALLICADQSAWLITQIDSKSGFAIRRADDLQSLARETLHIHDNSLVKARATALGWATRDAYRSGRDTLIFINPPPRPPLCELENNAQTGSRFVLCSLCVNLTGKPE